MTSSAPDRERPGHNGVNGGMSGGGFLLAMVDGGGTIPPTESTALRWSALLGLLGALAFCAFTNGCRGGVETRLTPRLLRS
jgi:hypothetical protein